METHLSVIGSILVLLGIVHAIFPRYFKWGQELKHLSLINRQMMQTHTFFIALVVALFGVLCITQAKDMVSTPLGRNMALGLAIFWGLRLIFQLFVYSPKLWRGRVFETMIHIVFTAFWIYMTVVFSIIYLGK